MAKHHLLSVCYASALLTAVSLSGSPLLAEPAAITSATLLAEPLGETAEPQMSLFILSVAPGVTIPSHKHTGAIFAYVLEGDIENQLEPDLPVTFHPGGVFHERAGQVHKMLHNLGTDAPARILVFQNTGTLPASIKPLLQQPLPSLANQDVRVISLIVPPGSELKDAHQHPGPVYAYVLRGEVESQVDPEPAKLYRAGEVFYEAPMHAHRVFRNPDQSEPAEVLVFEVGEKGKAPVMGLIDQAAILPPGPPAPPVPPGMMPYVAILDPQFVPAREAGFLRDEDVVVGVGDGRSAKAYPAADLGQHGSVNDVMPDGPIEVTWCGTCQTGAVFRAELDGQLLHFDYDSMVGANEVHIDRETGTRWQQSTGEGISGPNKGRFLELYPFVRTTWKEWRRRHPGTLVLKPMPGYDALMPKLSDRLNFITRDGGGDAPKTAFGKDDRLRPKEMIAGLRIGTEDQAYPFSQLRIARVVNDRVGETDVVIVHQPSSDTTTAFEAQAGGKLLHFQAADADATMLKDGETGSTWDAYGLCLTGPLKGTKLKQVILVPEFWFAWSEFHPGTRVFTAASQ